MLDPGRLPTVARSGRSDVGVGQQDRAALQAGRRPLDSGQPRDGPRSRWPSASCSHRQEPTLRRIEPPLAQGTRATVKSVKIRQECTSGRHLRGAAGAVSQAATLLHRLDTLTAQRSDRHELTSGEDGWSSFGPPTPAKRAMSAAVLDHFAGATWSGLGPFRPFPAGAEPRWLSHGGCRLSGISCPCSPSTPTFGWVRRIWPRRCWRVTSAAGTAPRLAGPPRSPYWPARRVGSTMPSDWRSALQSTETSGGTIALLELDARQMLADVCFERRTRPCSGLARDRPAALPADRCRPHLWVVEADLVRVMIARQPPGALPRLHTLRQAPSGPSRRAGPLRTSSTGPISTPGWGSATWTTPWNWSAPCPPQICPGTHSSAWICARLPRPHSARLGSPRAGF